MRRASPRAGWTLAALALLLLVAALLRFHRIDAQSLWADEGNSIAMAPRGLLEIAQRTARDIHPPLYYMALHGWTALTGSSATAARALSALFGIATVALTAALGWLTGGRRMALLAALAAVVAPFAIHYSQEARMYMMVTMLATASWLLYFRLSTDGNERSDGGAQDWRSTLYFLTTLAMLYTHYYAVSVVVAQNLGWLWMIARRGAGRRSDIWKWLALQSLLVVAYLPWLWYARETILNWPAISQEITLPFIAREIFRIFSIGEANEGMEWWSAAGFGALLVLGLAQSLRAGWSARRDFEGAAGGLVPLLAFAAPPLLMLALSLDRPFWNPKFLLLALPGYHLLVAGGAALLLSTVERGYPRLLPPTLGAVAAFLLIAPAGSLANEYWNPRYWRDDYRAIARTISAQATERDAVILDGPGQREIFDYYYNGSLPLYPMPTSRPLDERATIEQLEAIASRHERLFVIWWAEEQGDPALVIPRWLDENGFEAGSRWFGNVRLASYRMGELPAPDPLDVSFSLPDRNIDLRLDGASVEPTKVVAGEVIALNSVWRLENESDAPVTFFAQLLDSGNHVVGQYDGDGGAPPVADWSAGQQQSARMGVPVAVGTAPGEYRLIIGAYRTDTGSRLLSSESDSFMLATVQVTAPEVPPTLDALALLPHEARDAEFGDLTLIGARANRLGFDHAPDTPLAPGEPLSVLLHWRAESDAPAYPALILRLRDSSGAVAAEWPLEPTEGRYAPSGWAKAELVRDPQVRFLPGDLPAGDYRLVLESDRKQALLGDITIQIP